LVPPFTQSSASPLHLIMFLVDTTTQHSATL
jgi:hypothetical protein